MSADRYRVIRRIGVGNFTAGVYLAEHLDLGREVAIKLLEVDALTNRDELMQEARTMAALPSHDHVVQVLDAGDWDPNHIYIASEACLDGSLERRAAGGLDP